MVNHFKICFIKLYSKSLLWTILLYLVISKKSKYFLLGHGKILSILEALLNSSFDSMRTFQSLIFNFRWQFLSSKSVKSWIFLWFNSLFLYFWTDSVPLSFFFLLKGRTPIKFKMSTIKLVLILRSMGALEFRLGQTFTSSTHGFKLESIRISNP